MDKLISTLLTLFETEFTTTFKKYHYGDPHTYDRTVFPQLYVIPGAMEIVNSGTVRDTMNHEIIVRIIVDMKTYLNEGGSTQSASQALVKLVEETSSKEPIDKSIVGVVRKNINLSEYTLYNDNIAVEYSDEYIEAGKDALLKKADIKLSYSRQSVRNT